MHIVKKYNFSREKREYKGDRGTKKAEIINVIDQKTFEDTRKQQNKNLPHRDASCYQAAMAFLVSQMTLAAFMIKTNTVILSRTSKSWSGIIQAIKLQIII